MKVSAVRVDDSAAAYSARRDGGTRGLTLDELPSSHEGSIVVTPRADMRCMGIKTPSTSEWAKLL